MFFSHSVLQSWDIFSLTNLIWQQTINLIKPRGFLYVPQDLTKILHGARFALSVLYESQNRQRLLLYASLTGWFFITVVESVYSAVRTDFFYKADYF